MGNTHIGWHRLICTHLEDKKTWEWKCTQVFIINWSEILIIFQLIHLQCSVRRTGGWVEKDNDGTMRQKHPQNPTQNILFVLTVQHTQVVSLNLSDFRMEGGPWTPLKRNRQEIWEPPKKEGETPRRGALNLNSSCWAFLSGHTFFFFPLCAFLISLSPFLSFFPPVFFPPLFGSVWFFTLWTPNFVIRLD